MRDDIKKKRQERIQQEDLSEMIIRELREQIVNRTNIEVTLEIRKEQLKNLTDLLVSQNTSCDLNEINDENYKLQNYQQRENELESEITGADNDLIFKREQIENLKKALLDAQNEERGLVSLKTGK